ncbi:MAG: hypothetical protein ACI9IJ_001957, partial [Psychromonas sp.]
MNLMALVLSITVLQSGFSNPVNNSYYTSFA